MFNKYMHLEHLDNDEVNGIMHGEVYVFPKVDGTNASVWLDPETKQVGTGSRNRELSVEKDNAGFCNHINHSDVGQRLTDCVVANPHLTLFGEWLVPHSLKTYRDNAWRKFWIFDVYDRHTNQYLHYNDWSAIVKEYNLDYLPPIAVFNKGITKEDAYRCLDKNVFLIKDGEGLGEGVVLKNYNFVNQYGRTVWAKVVTSEFKEIHYREMGAPTIGGTLLEDKIVNRWITPHFVNKVHAKIAVEMNGWSGKYIPRLLQTVYYDLIREELWDILKEYNNPMIDFKSLQRLTISKIKELLHYLGSSLVHSKLVLPPSPHPSQLLLHQDHLTTQPNNRGYSL